MTFVIHGRETLERLVSAILRLERLRMMAGLGVYGPWPAVLSWLVTAVLVVGLLYISCFVFSVSATIMRPVFVFLVIFTAIVSLIVPWVLPASGPAERILQGLLGEVLIITIWIVGGFMARFVASLVGFGMDGY